MLHQLYREVQPIMPTSQWIECYWQIQSDRVLPEHFNRILPNGCIDIIFNLGDLPSRVEGDLPRLRSFVVGQMRKPITVWQDGAIDLVGIRFRLGSACNVLRVNAIELRNEN
jgi:hypothetical protein